MNQTKASAQRRAYEKYARELGGKLGDTEDFADSREPIDRLIASETAPSITHGAWLARHGFAFPTPGTLSPERVPAELTRLLNALAFARVFITGTDHLSDIQLYDRLSADVLAGEEPDVPRMENEMFHWNLSESENPDSKIFLSYYADDDVREEYRETFPSRPMPPRRTLPFRRESKLPKPFRLKYRA